MGGPDFFSETPQFSKKIQEQREGTATNTSPFLAPRTAPRRRSEHSRSPQKVIQEAGSRGEMKKIEEGWSLLEGMVSV